MDSDQISIAEIKSRLKGSFLSLTARQVVLRAASFISINLILARILPVETLGVFNIAASIITFFAFFSDVGLAASLIQKKEKISSDDIHTTFTIQQLLVGGISLIVIITAPFLASFYALGENGIWLIRALAVSFFLSSLKVVPSVMLERKLQFGPIVMVEVVETLTFNLLLIGLVILKFELAAFSIASIARGVVGTSLIYLLYPVSLELGIYRDSAKKLLSFGIPYQLNGLLALAKDRLVPLVVAWVIGPVGVGYVTWAQSIAFLPLEIMNMIIRLTFPAYSRLQEERTVLERAVEKSLYLTALMVYPLLFGLGAILPSVVEHIVSAKWEPAVSSFYLFATSAYWAVISTTLTNTLNAVGKIHLTLRLMVMWTILTWVLTPILTYYYGYLGVGLSSFMISFTSLATVWLSKRILNINISRSILSPTLASIIMAVGVYYISQILVRDQLTLFVAVTLGGVLYLLIIVLLDRRYLLTLIRSLKRE